MDPYITECKELLAHMASHGFEAQAVYDDDDGWCKLDGDDAARAKAIMATGEDLVRFSHDGVMIGKVFLVSGNDKGELVCDYATLKKAPEEIKAKFEGALDKWYELAQAEA